MLNKLLQGEKKIVGRQKVLLWGGLLLFGIYFLTRIYHLTVLPVFCDEAIYIRWAQIMRNEPSLRFLPLQDGKQPLFMWLVMPFLKVFSDPLFAGRFVSVLAGAATLGGILVLSYLFFKKETTALLTGIIVIFVPYLFFFDRMALVDSLLSAFGVWSLVFGFLLGKTERLDVAMILGMILGGALLTKSPGIFFVFLTPLAVLIGKEKGKKANNWKLAGLVLVAFGFSGVIYNILRLGPNFQMIRIRNKDYVWSVKEILKHPLSPFLPNLGDIFRYYLFYLTLPLFLLGGIGLGRWVKEGKREWQKWLVVLWWVLPLLAQAAVAKVLTARYLLFSVPIFILLVVEGWQQVFSWLKSLSLPKAGKIVFSFVLLLWALCFDWWLWHNPQRAPFPADERAGYLEDWTAGWGIKEIAAYLKKNYPHQPVVVGTEGFFGTLPQGLQIYLEGRRNITVIGVGYPIKDIPSSLANALKAGDDVYLVVNASRLEINDSERLELISAYQKPGQDKLLFLKLK
ncbi:glycosyltransferase family 39 protein [bacterium]|nr:glycosyltransferase family 39 protein [bacterium]